MAGKAYPVEDVFLLQKRAAVVDGLLGDGQREQVRHVRRLGLGL